MAKTLPTWPAPRLEQSIRSQVDEACLLWSEVLELHAQGREDEQYGTAGRYEAHVLEVVTSRGRRWLDQLRAVVDEERKFRQGARHRPTAKQRPAETQATLDKHDQRRLGEVYLLWQQVLDLRKQSRIRLVVSADGTSLEYSAVTDDAFDSQLAECLKHRYWQRKLRAVVDGAISLEVGVGVCLIHGVLKRRAEDRSFFDEQQVEIAHQLSSILRLLAIAPGQFREAFFEIGDRTEASHRLAVQVMYRVTDISVRKVGEMYRVLRDQDRLEAALLSHDFSADGAEDHTSDGAALDDFDNDGSDATKMFRLIGAQLGTPGLLEMTRDIE